MKIGLLEQHCGECDVIEFCGEGFCYCLCTDPRFCDIEEADYKRIAEQASGITEYKSCVDCIRPNCDVYRFSETDYANEPCEHRDESTDHYCHQVADYVATNYGR